MSATYTATAGSQLGHFTSVFVVPTSSSSEVPSSRRRMKHLRGERRAMRRMKGLKTPPCCDSHKELRKGLGDDDLTP